MKLSVYYEGQFWVGVVEEEHEGKLKAGRYVFGAEPNDAEILDFIEKRILDLTSGLSQEIQTKHSDERRVNPKRLARRVAAEMKSNGVSSQAQEALKLEYDKRKKEKKTLSRLQKEEMKERKREIKSQQAKDKHRGK
ncbi:YjdF family protein [Cohnella mopanensis]|uniref:YjdF family protein n=1 Tax=Cohnella mopanensis TaxID=2911966 RepID=UPI001EF7BDA4|nr:YjdF family protein [Cohnella mopanensis]